MVYLQVRLKLQDLHIETLQSVDASSGASAGGGGSSVSGVSGASGSGGLGLRGVSSVGLSDVGGISTGPNTPVKVSYMYVLVHVCVCGHVVLCRVRKMCYRNMRTNIQGLVVII